MKHIGLFALALMVSGCSGELRTVESGTEHKGVFVYPPKVLVERYEMTARTGTDKDGKVYDIPCRKVLKDSLVVRPDYSRPQRVYYEPGLLETNKFGLVLEDGKLKSVNVDSTPAQGQILSAIAGALKEAGIPIATPAGVAQLPVCDAVPRLVKVMEAPTTEAWSPAP